MGREVKRVALDFNWPIHETWKGYLNDLPYGMTCGGCDGHGSSTEAKRFQDEWYGSAPFDPVAYGSKPLRYDDPAMIAFARSKVAYDLDFYQQQARSFVYRGFPRSLFTIMGEDQPVVVEVFRLYTMWSKQWVHQLSQVDVDALVDDGRLMNFTHNWSSETGWTPKDPMHKVTADEVNSWSISGPFGHDSINSWICIKARCKREGVPEFCASCKGEGVVWESEEAKQRYESWEKTEPPSGDGWQMWETTSEGSPISPVFETPEELAHWLADNGASSFGGQSETFETWLNMICGSDYAPTMVMQDGVLYSGVEYAASRNRKMLPSYGNDHDE